MKFILGTKIGMTQIFKEDGMVVPVTKVKAGPCVITQVKTAEKDGVNAVQVGFGEQRTFRISKPLAGHLKGLFFGEQIAPRFLKDFLVGEKNELKRGDKFRADVFSVGDKVKVTGFSKGKGFQGVVKRHDFAGAPASHGHKDQLRMPGSIGAGGVQRVFKGRRMAGHMGDEQVTVVNLEIAGIDLEKNELFVKGALPGAKGGLILIYSEQGEMKIEKPEIETPVAVETEKQPEESPVQAAVVN